MMTPAEEILAHAKAEWQAASAAYNVRPVWAYKAPPANAATSFYQGVWYRTDDKAITEVEENLALMAEAARKMDAYAILAFQPEKGRVATRDVSG